MKSAGKVIARPTVMQRAGFFAIEASFSACERTKAATKRHREDVSSCTREDMREACLTRRHPERFCVRV